jgi:hypothetical protein
VEEEKVIEKKTESLFVDTQEHANALKDMNQRTWEGVLLGQLAKI